MYITLSIIGVIGIFVLYFYMRHFMPLRQKEDGFRYVYVEEDGTVRELDEEEIEYLNTEFHGADAQDHILNQDIANELRPIKLKDI